MKRGVEKKRKEEIRRMTSAQIKYKIRSEKKGIGMIMQVGETAAIMNGVCENTDKRNYETKEKEGSDYQL